MNIIGALAVATIAAVTIIIVNNHEWVIGGAIVISWALGYSQALSLKTRNSQ